MNNYNNRNEAPRSWRRDNPPFEADDHPRAIKLSDIAMLFFIYSMVFSGIIAWMWWACLLVNYLKN